MRYLLGTLLLLLSTTLAWADVHTNKLLSRAQVADGWVLLFDGETTFGWKAVNDAKWTVYNGMLYPQANIAGPLVTTTEFGEYELAFEAITRPGSTASVLLGCDANGAPLPATQTQRLGTMGRGWLTYGFTLQNGRLRTDTRSSGGLASFVRRGEQPASTGRGYIALAGDGVVFRNIELRPLGLQSVFNGKDLTGWKEFPGKKSQFTVTDNRELHLKNGPGDLQSEGQWGDFLLQLDCRCNGDRLNSGVFFRCRPGEYQNGYEAQIHNGFTDEPAKEYTLEEYDPETHKRTGTNKVKYTATDYGTGAIYRRQPARFQVAQDREWFTMTVAASGKHMAVWVNGLQVTDWTDNRPPSDNARNGCRLEKGPISLQGHDGTTDLNFRNIRIAELPPVAKK